MTSERRCQEKAISILNRKRLSTLESLFCKNKTLPEAGNYAATLLDLALVLMQRVQAFTRSAPTRVH
jgi:hypothetical protein